MRKNKATVWYQNLKKFEKMPGQSDWAPKTSQFCTYEWLYKVRNTCIATCSKSGTQTFLGFMLRSVGCAQKNAIGYNKSPSMATIQDGGYPIAITQQSHPNEWETLNLHTLISDSWNCPSGNRTIFQEPLTEYAMHICKPT